MNSNLGASCLFLFFLSAVRSVSLNSLLRFHQNDNNIHLKAYKCTCVKWWNRQSNTQSNTQPNRHNIFSAASASAVLYILSTLWQRGSIAYGTGKERVVIATWSKILTMSKIHTKHEITSVAVAVVVDAVLHAILKWINKCPLFCRISSSFFVKPSIHRI